MILPGCVKVSSAPIADYCPQLSGSEIAAVQNACQKRRREFSTGRMLLKQLFEQLGLGFAELPKDKSGRVLCPQGYCCSVAHCDDLCVAAASAIGPIVSIGIDVEIIADVGERECDVFMPGAEYDSMRLLEPAVACIHRAASFSVREAVYKCLNPVYGRWIDFKDASVSFSSDDCSLLNVKVKGYPDIEMQCRYVVKDDKVFTSAVLLNRDAGML